jgi:hypothetical protein
VSGMDHIGRSWAGHPLEDTCPCEKAPCGLAIANSNTDCPEHGMGAMKTLRQWHGNKDCPARARAITMSKLKPDTEYQLEVNGGDPIVYRTIRDFGHDD